MKKLLTLAALLLGFPTVVSCQTHDSLVSVTTVTDSVAATVQLPRTTVTKVYLRLPNTPVDTAKPTPSTGFYSDWGTATGTTTAALTDGGRWTDNIGPHNNIAVVPAPAGGPFTNAYRVTNSATDLGYNWVEKSNLWPSPKVGETRYFRVYLLNAVANSEGDRSPEASYHPLEAASAVSDAGSEQFNLIFNSRADGTFLFKFAPLAAAFPANRWSPSATKGVQSYLPKFVWLRLEWSLTKTATGYQLHAWIYNLAGTLLYDDSSIRDASLAGTLSAAGPFTGLSDLAAGQLRLGTNGGSLWFGLKADQYVYWAGFCSRLGTRCGAYVKGEH